MPPIYPTLSVLDDGKVLSTVTLYILATLETTIPEISLTFVALVKITEFETSPMPTFPTYKVAAPTNNPCHFLVNEPSVNAPEDEGNTLPNIVMSLLNLQVSPASE